MPQYVTVTGDKRFEGVTNAVLIPGLHGVGLVDGREVSIVQHGTDIHAVPSYQVEVWSTHAGHPASGLQYQGSDRSGYRIICRNYASGDIRVLASITDADAAGPEERELYRNFNVRVDAAIEALGE